MKIASVGIAMVVVLAAATPAHAQAAEAETLFREGKKLMKQGDVAEACEKFEASERLEASLGTELNLADCREKNGQLASAWAMFVKASVAAKRIDDNKRETEAKRRAEALEPQLVYLTIEVAEDRHVDELVIKRNGKAVDPELWNQKVPVDPDRYTISAEAPGYEPWTTTVTVKAKNKKLEMPALEKQERKTSRRKPDKAEASEDEEGTDEAAPGPRRRFTGIAIGLGLVGMAAVGTGVWFGLKGKDLEDQSDALCPTTSCADPKGVQLNKDARRDALFANIGFIAGGAAIAGAVTLLILGAPDESKQVSIVPRVGGDQLGLAVGGRF